MGKRTRYAGDERLRRFDLGSIIGRGSEGGQELLSASAKRDIVADQRETFLNLANSIETVLRYAGLSPGSIGLYRMWWRALLQVRPRNPRLFGFYLMRALDWMDKRQVLDDEFYSPDMPRIDKGLVMEEEYNKWEREQLDERVKSIRKANTPLESRADMEAAKRQMHENRNSNGAFLDEHLRRLQREEAEFDRMVSVRPATERPAAWTKAPGAKSKSREQLLRELVQRVKVLDLLERKIADAEAANDFEKAATLREQASHYHFGEELREREQEAVFTTASEEEMEEEQAHGRDRIGRHSLATEQLLEKTESVDFNSLGDKIPSEEVDDAAASKRVPNNEKHQRHHRVWPFHRHKSKEQGHDGTAKPRPASAGAATPASGTDAESILTGESAYAYTQRKRTESDFRLPLRRADAAPTTDQNSKAKKKRPRVCPSRHIHWQR